MADHSELKRLAESLNRAIEQAEHKPGQWAEAAQSMGGICCAGEPFQIGKPWAKEESWAHFSYKRDSWLAVAAVNALPQLMALIVENERLKTLRSKTERDLAQELEVWRHGPSCWNCGDSGDVHDIVGEWRGKCDCFAAQLIDATQERDQLRAEIAGLKTGYEAYEQVNAGLKAEVEVLTPDFEEVERICKALGWLGVSAPSGGEERAARWIELVKGVVRAAEQSKMLRQDAGEILALRKDAERYRWIEPVFAGLFGIESLDAHIDAAMGEGGRS